ncbi:hypothetical protein [Ideonella sp.]|uniref:hypothetical protein n=1 Tax=Ideonella sp. TaxID=1929293 RepID=UPI003BB4EEB1
MANSREAQVKVTADVGDLEAGMNAGAAVVEQQAARMRSAFERLRERTGPAMDEVRSKTVGAINPLGVAFAGLQGVIAGMTAGALVSLGRELVDQIDSFNDWADATGATVESLSSLDQVARRTGASLDTVGGILLKVQMAMKATDGKDSFALAIRQIGLDVEKLRDMDPAEMLRVIAKALNGFADDGNKARLIMELTGRSAKEAAPFLKDLGEQAETAGDLTSAQAQQAEELNKQLFQMQANIQDAARAMMSSLIPSLTNLARELNAGIQAFGGFGSALLSLGTEGAGPPIERLQIYQQRLAELHEAMDRARKEEPNAFTSKFLAESEKIEASYQRYIRYYQTVLGLNSQAGGGRGFVNPEGDRPSVGTPPKPAGAAKEAKDKPEASGMGRYQQQLEAMKQLAAEEDATREFSKQQELDYWQTVLQSADLTSNDTLAILRNVSKLKIEILRDEAKQRLQLDASTRDRAEAAALADVSADQASAQRQVDLGQMTQAQLLELEAGFEDRRFAIKQAYLQARLAIIDPDRDPVAYSQVSAQLEALEVQHQAAMGQIKGKAAVEGAAKQEQFFQSLQQGFSKLTESLMQKTFTWRGAFSTVLQGLRKNFAQMGADMLVNWVKTHLQMQAVSKTSTLEQIHQNAMKAASAAFSAVAGIPYVGPTLAPVAAAAAYAGTMAFASAEGGYDIPAGTNPLTQLHAREMVLPAKHADVIRSMADGGGGGGGELTVHIHALDGASVERVLMGNQSELARAIQTAHRNRLLDLGKR